MLFSKTRAVEKMGKDCFQREGPSSTGKRTEVFETRFESPIGTLTISGRASAIEAVEFCETPLPKRSDSLPEVLLDCRSQLAEYFSGQRRVFEIELKPGGTPFQRRVWSILLSIPYGETRRYMDIAEDIGNSMAARAVGRANAMNPISIIIPCHRLVGAGGGLVGYGGGLWRKKWLLRHEKRFLP
jgi:methylated-DNA-[protein]-cysteine S-methyltransferase